METTYIETARDRETKQPQTLLACLLEAACVHYHRSTMTSPRSLLSLVY